MRSRALSGLQQIISYQLRNNICIRRQVLLASSVLEYNSRCEIQNLMTYHHFFCLDIRQQKRSRWFVYWEKFLRIIAQSWDNICFPFLANKESQSYLQLVPDQGQVQLVAINIWLVAGWPIAWRTLLVGFAFMPNGTCGKADVPCELLWDLHRWRQPSVFYLAF